MRDLAIGQRGIFAERYDVDLTQPAPPAPDLSAGVTALAGPAARLARYCRRACTNPGEDQGYDAAMTLVGACERLVDEPPADADQAAAAVFGLPTRENKTAPGGRKAAWDAAEGGTQELQDHYKTLVAAVVDLRKAYAAHLTGLAVEVASTFTQWAAARLLEAGRLDFADLLGRLRDLLRDDVSARVALQRRFDFVLVDEFQDTDPLQAEIVFFLCERRAATQPAARWDEVVLAPGKLFVVGDPKQSIYRFRRADISLYTRVGKLIAGQPGGSGQSASLLRNFRTTPEVVGWVNDTFADVFESDYEPGRQPHYQGVEPDRRSIGGPGVAVLRAPAVEHFERRVGAARAAEARAVAALLLRDVRSEAHERRRVEDDGALRHATLERRGPAVSHVDRPRDVRTGPARGRCPVSRRRRQRVLQPARGRRRASLPACGRRPQRRTGGLRRPAFHVLRLQRRRPLSVLAGRRAFRPVRRQASRRVMPPWKPDCGCSPASIARAAGPSRTRSSPSSCGWSMRLNRLRHRASAPTRRSPISRSWSNRPGPHSAAGGGGLGEFLAWAAEAGGASGESESPVDDEGDAVHLFTIHKAKGLERRIIVLIGGSLQGAGGGGRGAVEPIVDRDDRSVSLKLKVDLAGVGSRDLVSQAYEDAKANEDQMAASESRRLLYVALTRARDHLVHHALRQAQDSERRPVCRPSGTGRRRDTRGARLLDRTYDDVGVLVLAPGEPVARRRPAKPVTAASLLTARGRWVEARGRLLAEASRPARATSPSALEHLDDEVRAGGPGAAPGRAAALVLGSAVHRIMELCDLGDEASVARLAPDVADEFGRADLAAEAAELALACWRSAPVRAAASAAADASGIVMRELPVAVLVADVVVSGAVDLLYRDGDDWVVVDYKTDRGVGLDEVRERYVPQGAAYAHAVEAATGARVREVAFVAARLRLGASDPWAGVVRVVVDDALRARVAADAAAAVSQRRAIVAEA